GPNGFLRVFRGMLHLGAAQIDASADYDRDNQSLRVTVRNAGSTPAELTARPRAYAEAPVQHVQLGGGESATLTWPIAASAHWYDLEIISADRLFYRRFAGHVETGASS